MKKLLTILLVLLVPVVAEAQTNIQTTQLQARWTGMTVASAAALNSGLGECVKANGRPVTSHSFTFTVNRGSGSVSAILVTANGSTDGGATFSSVGTSTNTAGATISPATAPYTDLCIALSSITGGGSPTIDVAYNGVAIGAGGAVTVSGNVATTGADGSSVALGATTDAKCLTTDATACSLIALTKAVSANTALIAGAVVPVSSACAIVTTASTNSTSCKGSSGFRTGFWVINTTATLYYLRFYNTASAPTCSSATGFIQSVPIPASTTGAGIVVSIPNSVAFSTGFGYCVTASSTSTANDNAAAGIFGEAFFN